LNRFPVCSPATYSMTNQLSLSLALEMDRAMGLIVSTE